MALRTTDEYLDSIRARELRVFYRGERMSSVVYHPVAAPAARCVAEVYRAALDPATAPMMTHETANGREVPTEERMAVFRLLEFLTHCPGAVYFSTNRCTAPAPPRPCASCCAARSR